MRLLEGAGSAPSSSCVAGEISRLLADGMAPGEIAVAVRGGGVSHELLEEVLSRAGVPARDPATPAAAATARSAGR